MSSVLRPNGVKYSATHPATRLVCGQGLSPRKSAKGGFFICATTSVFSTCCRSVSAGCIASAVGFVRGVSPRWHWLFDFMLFRQSGPDKDHAPERDGKADDSVNRNNSILILHHQVVEWPWAFGKRTIDRLRFGRDSVRPNVHLKVLSSNRDLLTHRDEAVLQDPFPEDLAVVDWNAGVAGKPFVVLCLKASAQPIRHVPSSHCGVQRQLRALNPRVVKAHRTHAVPLPLQLAEKIEYINDFEGLSGRWRRHEVAPEVERQV